MGNFWEILGYFLFQHLVTLSTILGNKTFCQQVAERENLLGKLSEYVSSERKTFNTSGAIHEISGVPKTINNIYFVRQLEAKVKDILKTGLTPISSVH